MSCDQSMSGEYLQCSNPTRKASCQCGPPRTTIFRFLEIETELVLLDCPFADFLRTHCITSQRTVAVVYVTKMHLVSQLLAGKPFADLIPGKLSRIFSRNWADLKRDRAQCRGNEYGHQLFHGDMQSLGDWRFTTSSRKISCTSGTLSCRSGLHNLSCKLVAGRRTLCSLIVVPALYHWSHINQPTSAPLSQSPS